MSIENLKKAAKLAISFGQKIEATTKDGFQVTDLFQFLGEVGQIPGIVATKDAILSEIKGIDAAGRAELSAYIEQELVLENKKVEGIIESVLNILVALFVLIDRVKTSNSVDGEPIV